MTKQSKVLIYILFLGMISASCLAVSYRWGSTNLSSTWIAPAVAGAIVSDVNAAFHYEDLPITYDGLTTQRQYGIFQPTESDTLTIVDTVRIKGDVEIRFNGAGPATEPEIFEINIGTPLTATSPVTIAAYTSNTTTIDDYAQLIFNPGQGKTIVVNVYADLLFRSADNLLGYDPEDEDSVGAPMPLYVTFRGKGSTVFRLPSGRTISFGPPNPGHTAEGDIVADSPLSTEGVHVSIYMEQGVVDAYGSAEVDPGSQVVFEKWSYTADSVNTNLALDTWVNWGQKSSFVFISDNGAGITEAWDDTNNNQQEDLGETVLQPGYGSIAFDPSNAGSGRLILQLAKGQLPSGNDFTDAGFNIYGALLVPTVPSTSRQRASVFNADFRNAVYFNQRAGLKALFRIVDDVAYYELVTLASVVDDVIDEDLLAVNQYAYINRDVSSRRGLVVINHNNSIPHFTNNYDLAERIDESVWGQFNDYEPGFILGVNGSIEVNPHMFLDYIANNNNVEISSAHADVSTTHTAQVVKKHNPAALYTDTLPTYQRRSLRGTDRYGVPISDLQYAGNAPAAGSHPTIVLKGDAGCFVRCAAQYDNRALLKTAFPQPYTPEYYSLALSPSDDTKVITVALGIGVYDGTYIPILDENNAPVMQIADLDGAHALDVEGTCTIVSEMGGMGEPAAGFFCVPSVEIDYAGREVGYDNFEQWASLQAWLATNPGPSDTYTFTPSTGGDSTQFTPTTAAAVQLTQSPWTLGRPLSKNQYYATYDVSTIFLNANLVFDSVKWIHSDVTRKLDVPGVLPTPFLKAKPHVVGAELASLTQDLYPPLLKLYNSTLECHESLVLSGVALTTHEYRGAPGSSANNISRIACYNRGRDYDSNGYGRVIQFGSQGNVAADGETTTLLLDSAYLDVYRAAPPYDATVDAPTIIKLIVESRNETLVTQTDRSLHSLYLANGSQVHLGWPTLEGDSGYLPAIIDSVVLEQLVATDPINRNGFRFNPYETGVGHLLFAGGPFYIGAGDEVDALPPLPPIPGIDVDGVVYVNYGGMLSVVMPDDITYLNDGTTDNPLISIRDGSDLYIDTVVARRKAADPLASGVVLNPSDLVHFSVNGALQDYNLDFTTDAAPDGMYQNNILVSGSDSIHVFDVAKLYESTTTPSVKSIGDDEDDE